MPDPTTTTTTTTADSPPDHRWGTLEDLLLAFAVNRHGAAAWDSVSSELQKRFSTTTTTSFSPQICRQKHLDLKRRFSALHGGHCDGDYDNLWLEELRKLRVAELKRELQRNDLSIVSLQLKVRRLKEERERADVDEERENPDLEKNEEREGAKNELPENGETNQRNDSINESNSTESKPEAIDSFNGSSNSKDEQHPNTVISERVDSGELGESVDESKGSDVHSTARREKKVGVTGSSSGKENESAAVRSINDGKSQPLIDFFHVVRSWKLCSVFGRGLESQETLKYRNLIRQHVDMEMIERRLEEGDYADCNTKFYRDLMLLICNAIIFFDNKSSEHTAALELRRLVTKQSSSHLNPHKTQAPKSNPPASVTLKPPKPELNPADHTVNLKPKLVVTGPVIACRKRSSIAGKSSAPWERKEPLAVTLAGEKPAAGEKITPSFNALTKKRTRDQSFVSKNSSSMNNSSSNKSMHPTPNPSQTPSQKPKASTPLSTKGEKPEAKADKKKPSPGNSSSKVKRGSESDNRSLLEMFKKVEHKNGNNRRVVKEKGKGKEEKETPASRSIGRLAKRAVATAKRNREGGVAESAASKRRRK